MKRPGPCTHPHHGLINHIPKFPLVPSTRPSEGLTKNIHRFHLYASSSSSSCSGVLHMYGSVGIIGSFSLPIRTWYSSQYIVIRRRTVHGWRLMSIHNFNFAGFLQLTHIAPAPKAICNLNLSPTGRSSTLASQVKLRWLSPLLQVFS